MKLDDIRERARKGHFSKIERRPDERVHPFGKKHAGVAYVRDGFLYVEARPPVPHPGRAQNPLKRWKWRGAEAWLRERLNDALDAVGSDPLPEDVTVDMTKTEPNRAEFRLDGFPGARMACLVEVRTDPGFRVPTEFSRFSFPLSRIAPFG